MSRFNIHLELKLLKINRSQNMKNSSYSSPENSTKLQHIPNLLWILLSGLVTALAAIFIFKAPASTVFAVGTVLLVTFFYIYTHPKQSSHRLQTVPADLQAVDHAGDPQVDPAFQRSGGCH
jgi:hypothetical protein